MQLDKKDYQQKTDKLSVVKTDKTNQRQPGKTRQS